MNTYLVELRFLKPFESFGDVVGQHRSFLQGGYDQGLLLLSGPRADKQGGIVIARADDEQTLERYFAADPYRQAGLAEHRIVPFSAAKYAPFVEEWIRGTDHVKMSS